MEKDAELDLVVELSSRRGKVEGGLKYSDWEWKVKGFIYRG